MELPASADFVVVGGGIVGLTLALELARRHAGARVVVLEKEASVGAHASGRNSGVIHAGFYYAADSLKARLTQRGNQLLSAWCEEHGVPIVRCGKLVLARSEADHGALDELMKRAQVNGVRLDEIGEDETRRLEPHARTVGRALYSPTTGLVDPRALMAELARQIERAGITLATSTAWQGRRDERVLTSRGSIAAGFVVNAAGLHADRVARAYGFGERYSIVPFKGVYLYGNDRAPRLRAHLYPVPDLQMPFLGVHLTITSDGGVKIGPTAQPALWREAYGPLFSRGGLAGLSARDVGEAVAGNARLLAKPGMLRHAWREGQKSFRRALVREAASLADGITLDAFDRWGEPGIRAQLFDRERAELVMDFVHEGDDRSLHVLNAVSPAFTCSFALAELLADLIPTR